MEFRRPTIHPQAVAGSFGNPHRASSDARAGLAPHFPQRHRVTLVRGFWHLFRNFQAALRTQERRPLRFSRTQFPALASLWLDISCTSANSTARTRLPEGVTEVDFTPVHREEKVTVLLFPSGDCVQDSLLTCDVCKDDFVGETCSDGCSSSALRLGTPSGTPPGGILLSDLANRHRCRGAAVLRLQCRRIRAHVSASYLP